MDGSRSPVPFFVTLQSTWPAMSSRSNEWQAGNQHLCFCLFQLYNWHKAEVGEKISSVHLDWEFSWSGAHWFLRRCLLPKTDMWHTIIANFVSICICSWCGQLQSSDSETRWAADKPSTRTRGRRWPVRLMVKFWIAKQKIDSWFQRSWSEARDHHWVSIGTSGLEWCRLQTGTKGGGPTNDRIFLLWSRVKIAQNLRNLDDFSELLDLKVISDCKPMGLWNTPSASQVTKPSHLNPVSRKQKNIKSKSRADWVLVFPTCVCLLHTRPNLHV